MRRSIVGNRERDTSQQHVLNDIESDILVRTSEAVGEIVAAGDADRRETGHSWICSLQSVLERADIALAGHVDHHSAGGDAAFRDSTSDDSRTVFDLHPVVCGLTGLERVGLGLRYCEALQIIWRH